MSEGMEKRTDDMSEIESVGPRNIGDWLPDFMEEDDTVEELLQHRILPRLKIVQGQSKIKQAGLFEEGDVVLMPLKVKLCGKDGRFQFCPVLLFSEFILWRDLHDASGNKIVERSFDKAGKIASRAKDPNRREEPYGEIDPKTKQPKFSYSYVEHTNFAGVIYNISNEDLKGTPVVMSFERGEFTNGENFCGSLSMRKWKGKIVPYYTTVWDFTLSQRVNTKGAWFGFDFANPKENPYVTRDEAIAFKAEHDALKAFYKRSSIHVDRADEDEETFKESEGAEF
jgi:hypothetical protein